jgi:hypothetical protein
VPVHRLVAVGKLNHHGVGPAALTEVKVLSEQDERLKPPPTPTRVATGATAAQSS